MLLRTKVINLNAWLVFAYVLDTRPHRDCGWHTAYLSAHPKI
jgi:hypothetical protein